MKIEGVIIEGDAIYSEGEYSVYVGRMAPEVREGDIAHYLVINDRYKVVEGSSARVFEARGLCHVYNKELDYQNERLAQDMDIVQTEANGNVDPEFENKKGRKWDS